MSRLAPILASAGLPTRTVAGLVVAVAIAVAARRARALRPSGALAAVVVGTVAVAAGWAFGALLVAYFVSSSALSRWRSAEKERRTGSVVEKGGERDARQVLANGLAFAACAVGALAAASPRAALAWSTAAAGALAAAAADTWATEIGTLAAGAPRSVRTWRPVPAGTSGAVSLPGTAGMLLGALLVAALATALGIAPLGAVVVGGVVGATADTLLGATAQERRWCDACARDTERHVHDCGVRTVPRGGVRALDNDVVNLACAIVGAAASAAIVRVLGGAGDGA